MEYLSISRSAWDKICAQAKRGYEARWKEEACGFLFGRPSSGRRWHIETAVPYCDGSRTRTGVVLGASVEKRRRQLGRRLRSTFFGMYHTHVEIAGRVPSRLSYTDLRQLHSDPDAWIALLAVVWVSACRRPPPPQSKALAGFDPHTRYQYRIKAYVKSGGREKLVALRVA